MRVGLDIGSTTIKCVVLSDAGEIIYSTYERHFSHILEKGRELLARVAADYGCLHLRHLLWRNMNSRFCLVPKTTRSLYEQQLYIKYPPGVYVD